MKKILLIVMVALGLGACSSIQVSSDYDKNADFAKYKTYAFTQEALNLPINQLNRDRIIAAVEAQMAAKGFSKSDTPDALVQLDIKTAQRTEAVANTTGTGAYGYGYGRYGWGGGFTTTTVDYNEYTDGTLFVSFIDKATEKIFWMGRATKTIDENASADKREKSVSEAVRQIFLKYPPQITKK